MEEPRCAMCGKVYDDAPKYLCPECQAIVFTECECDLCKKRRTS